MSSSDPYNRVQWLKPRDHTIVQHWLNGMTIKSISTLVKLNPGSVRETISTYCDREIVHRPGNPVYFFRLVRKIHPDAPLSSADIMRLFPAVNAMDASKEGDIDPVLMEVAALSDRLNAVLEHAYANGHRNRIHLQLRDGRLHCVVRADM